LSWIARQPGFSPWRVARSPHMEATVSSASMRLVPITPDGPRFIQPDT
jgi:hypothetical protein